MPSIRNIGLCLALYVAATPLAVMANGERANLIEVYQLAVQNDAQLSAARHDYLARKEAVPQALAGLLPNLSAGVTADTTFLEREDPALERTRSGTVFRANLSQPLFNLERWFQLRAAQSTTAQAEIELRAQEQTLILRSAKAYFETLRSLDDLAASRAVEAGLLEVKQQAEARMRDGAASIIDVLDAKAAFDKASASRIEAEQEVKKAFEALFRLTKRRYTTIAAMHSSLPVHPPQPTDIAAWTTQATEQNLMLIASDFAVEAAQETRRQSRSGHAPTVQAVVSYREGDNDSFGYSNPTDFRTSAYQGSVRQSSVGIEFSIPLFAGGQTSSRIRESTERLLKSEDERDDRRREVVETTRNTFRSVLASIEQISAQQQSVASSEKAVEANRVGLRVGIRNTSDVLNAQRQLYDAIRDYNKARYDYVIGTLALKQVVGTLDPTDLSYLNRYMLPAG